MTNGSLNLFGALKVIYSVRDTLHIDRYSYVQIHTTAESVAGKTEICFYENEEEAIDAFIQYLADCVRFEDVSVFNFFEFCKNTIHFFGSTLNYEELNTY